MNFEKIVFYRPYVLSRNDIILLRLKNIVMTIFLVGSTVDEIIDIYGVVML